MYSELLEVFLRILLLWARMILEVVFSNATSDDCTTRPRVAHIVSINTSCLLCSDHIGDVLDTLIVKVKVTEVWLASVYEDAQEL